MTAISLRQAALLSRPSRSPITAAITVARFSTGHNRYLAGSAALHEHFKVGNIISRPQAFADGFVDFLLGRGARPFSNRARIPHYH